MPDGATPRERRIADEELAMIARTGDPVSELHRQITGQAVRLHIPLKDPVQIRRVATALRILASTLEAEAQRKDEAWRVLFSCKNAVLMCNRVIGGRKSR